MNNKEKFLNLVSEEQSNTLKNLKERKNNRAMLRESQSIAFKVLMRLETLKWTQKKLAEKLEVTPQQVSKIISGKENLTLETLVKLQAVLDIPLLVTCIERAFDGIMETHKVEVTQDYDIPENITISVKQNSPVVKKLSSKQETETYNYFPIAN
ncbi:helix-turn-helix transcriptional regulator [Flavobacterium sp.]|jgi:plasmid maintenance system antidote protein VapI|uniref:helix-turn-helix transcriptional regulator n=1 Tax=Flavobacterium sp. TaxID=239 RepID=UPI0022C6C8FA|nr:helix-turn-helix transcriptional regulator [Flavobacterium sp.]MCZ8091101.1 helix-turn-helix transcriptional regulator [Flavobacterium sp.]